MGERQECSILKLKDNQIECSWIPNTPAKPGLAKKQPICEENPEIRSSLANWLHLGLTPPPTQADIRSSLVPGDSVFYQQEIQAQTDGYFRNQSLGIASEGSVCKDSSLMYSNYCNERLLGIESEGSVCGDASLMYANYCNERLMQLTNAAASAAPGHRALHVGSSYTASASHYQVEGVPLQAGPLISSWANEKSLLSESRHEERNTLGVDEDTSWLPFVPSLSHHPMMGAGLRADILYHPAGVTPNRTTTANKEKDFDATNFCVDEAVNETDQCIAKEAANETDQCIAKEADEDSTHKQVEHDSCKLQDGQSESPDHISCSATSKTLLQENHEPDMGSNQDVDLKTPQQKPKRKKHRPKVIRSDQPKRNGSTQIAQSEKSTPAKRKYTRKNTASTHGNNALNGRIGTDPAAEGMQRPKRMCVKRKGIDQQASTPLEEDISEITCPQTNHTTRKSCRRSLSFDSYSLASEGSLCQPVPDFGAKTNSQNSCAEDQMPSMRKLGKGLDVMIEMTGMDHASDLTQTPKKYLEEYLSMEETNTPCPSTPVKCDQLVSKLMAGSSNGYLRGKCQVVFSNTTHDKEPGILNARTPVDQCTARNPGISDCSRMLCQEAQAGGRKRGRPSSNNVSDSCSKTAVWAERNSLQKCPDIRQPIEYYKILQTLHFPAICKKKRTERVYTPTTSCMLPTVSLTNCYVQNKASLYKNSCREALPSSFGTMQVHCSRSRISRNGNIQLERTNLNYSSLGIPKPLTKKRSKGLTRPRDLASLDRLIVTVHGSSSKLALPDVQSAQYPETCRKALVAGTPPILITKKRSKTYVLGFSSAMTSESLPSVDAIVQQFSRLDIAAECTTLANLETNLLAAYHYEYHGRNAVVNRIGWTMIPFGALYDYNRRHRPRPKVELDEETTRVWKLLLEDINNEGVDGTDEENRKKWQEERRVFRGRANSFISKMRLVQGDRRFRPWKGSVVDSVVGVFLTQNVSDHLSSSAFMSMAARFPLKPSSNEESSFEGIIDTTDLLYVQNICGDDSAALQFMKNNRRNDSQTFFRNPFEDIKSTDNLRFPTSDSSECGPSMLTEINICKFDAFNDDAIVQLDEDQRAFNEAISSQNSVVSPHNSVDSAGQIIKDYQLCTNSVLGEESTSKSCKDTSFLKLLQMQEHGFDNSGNRKESPMVETLTNYEVIEGNLESMRSDDHEKVKPAILSSCLSCINIDSVDADRSDFEQILASCLVSNLGGNEHLTTEQSGMSEESAACSVGISFDQHKHSCENHIVSCTKLGDNLQRGPVHEVQEQKNNDTTRELTHTSTNSEGTLDSFGSTRVEDETINSERRAVESDASSYKNLVESTNVMDRFTLKTRRGESVKKKQNKVNWDELREQAHAKCKRDRTASTMDSVDWEAVRCAEVGEIAETIKERGMNNMLAERIKDFLNRLIRDHEKIDLEWLRDVPPDKAKEYLLSFRGLGLKSVECVRLLTLHQVAFPVDTNVGRIAVRLGWVPLQPLPESLQLHLLEMYPVLESIQKYLWPRLCKLDQRKLYELHYQMITFGKVFCTKNKPNCNSCPMRAECRHFASAYASARLALPAPEDRRIVTAKEDRKAYTSQAENLHHLQLPTAEFSQHLVDPSLLTLSQPTLEVPATPKPIIEEPETPELEPIIEEPETPELEPIIEEFEIESESTQFPVDIEDMFLENDDEIPTIVLNIEALNRNVQNIIQNNAALQESEKSKAVVAITPEAASIPMPKLKNINRLRTEHQVYVIPDSHELLKGLDNRERNDPSPYLLAIWSPGETINSIQPPERRCSIRESGQLCFKDTCFSCNSIREATSQTVRGTILIPCRTAMRGSFPLNGTYFQVNEVFADHESSLNPINIPRNWLWNLRRRTVYFGTSIPTIFKGLGPSEIQHCFWRGFVCVRGFDRVTRAPRPLIARLHFPASKLAKYRETAKSTLPRYMSD